MKSFEGRERRGEKRGKTFRYDFEYCTEDDIFFDYCLWEYRPVASHKDKFRSINILYHSLDLMDIDERFLGLIRAIREGMGCSQTVWGLKRVGNKIGCELYFYDYRRRERERSITRFIDVIKPFIICDMKVNEKLHYFMFSVDITGDHMRGTSDLDEIHMYIGNPGSTVSSGICYSLTAEETKLENFYFFFDAQKQRDDIVAKVVCSAHIDFTEHGIDSILWPELRNCGVIVVANKQKNDAIYFSHINVDQFIFFLKQMNYPRELSSFVEENRDKLDHLQYDVGFDYRQEGKDIKIVKSGFYGVF